MITLNQKYHTKKHGVYECIYIRGNIAWMISSDKSTGYTWDATTGKSLTLSEDWDIDFMSLALQEIIDVESLLEAKSIARIALEAGK